MFSVNVIMITISGYPLSYIEFFGTTLYFLSVFLISRKNIITWPVGIVSVLLYLMLFYQIQLYADMIEQVYYLAISVIGWAAWHKQKEKQPEKSIETAWSSLQGIALTAVVTLAAAIAVSFCTARFHLWLPSIFTEKAAFPFMDAFTTIMSFTAMYLTTIRKNEAWLYWIVVDIIAVWLYWVKGVRFIAVQYVVLLGMAVYGFFHWKKSRAPSQKKHLST
jgi:nicotinamide mononucleotide transporter